MRLIEHVSAFTVFPNDGIRIDPHMIRRVTSYDGALLEEAHPEVHDVISPDVARTMTAMLEEVMQFGTAIKAKNIGRPAGGKTGTTQDFTDAWFIGFTHRGRLGRIRRQANFTGKTGNRRASRAAYLDGVHRTRHGGHAGHGFCERGHAGAAGQRTSRQRRYTGHGT
jgi:membrane peptidoglycan carboxypeptidase